VVTRVEAKEDGVTVVSRPSAWVETTATADVAVMSVGVEIEETVLPLLVDGVTKRVEVLIGQPHGQTASIL
jgi:hypothetical protein